MNKFQKQSLVWFVIYLVVLGSVILSTSSCTSTRQNGCYDTRHLVGYK
jgi:NhaP-type Na+/H+ or K+/H+ antiporter